MRLNLLLIFLLSFLITFGKDFKKPQKYRCGEKKYCSQMRSCEEAMFYYKVCGLKRLDGDNDGVPCERLCGWKRGKL